MSNAKEPAWTNELEALNYGVIRRVPIEDFGGAYVRIDLLVETGESITMLDGAFMIPDLERILEIMHAEKEVNK